MLSGAVETCDAVIVGAGAAGLATAIFAARAYADLRIAALDGARKLGAKILVSGGGRCNVTNARVTPADYYGGNPNVIRRVLRRFDEHAAQRFFAELGVPLHEEEDGKLFPDSNSAKTVVAALLRECARLGVRLLTEHRVIALERDAEGLRTTAQTPDGPRRFRSPRVVLATGGLSLPKTGSDGGGYALAAALGHSLTPTTPALDPLLLAGEFHQPLSGVSHGVELTCCVEGAKPTRIAGPLLWTHFGASGPAALNVSRHWNRAQVEGTPARIAVNFAGGASFEQVEQTLLEAARAQPKSRPAAALRRGLPARVADALVAACKIPPTLTLGQLDRDRRRALVHALTAWPLPVTGTRGYKHAEVTAGGVPLSEIDPAAMESRCCAGLHLVGEIVDVDGRLGGFNFQWAWSSGYVAGVAVAAGTG